MVDGLGAASLAVSVVAAGLASWAGLSARTSAVAAKDSAAEARRARLDELGPQVSIGPVEGLAGRWEIGRFPQAPNLSAPGKADPGTEYVIPMDEGIRVMLGAKVLIRNEGDRSATVEIRSSRIDRADDPNGAESVLSPAAGDRPTEIPTGKLDLPPHTTVEVVVREGPTIAQAGNMKVDHPIEVRISAWSSPEGARQAWSLLLQGPLLNPKPGDAARYVMMPGIPPEAAIKEHPRIYPNGKTTN